MMTRGAEGGFELVPIDGPIGGFPDAHATAAALADAIGAIPGLDRAKLLLFGGWESATRGAGVTLQLVGERLGITDQFQGVDQIEVRRTEKHGSFEVLERVEGGKAPGIVNARERPRCWGGRREILRSRGTIRRWAWRICGRSCRRCRRRRRQRSTRMRLRYIPVSLPKQQRTTRVVKDMSADEIADELVAWIGAE